MSSDTPNEGVRGDGGNPARGLVRPAAIGGAAAELGQIVSDVESFLHLWMTRLEAVLHRCDPANGAAELESRIAEFEDTQHRWHLRRQRDLQQIQETSDQLSAAWDRLEHEQRRLLHSQDGRTTQRCDASPEPLSTESPRPANPTRPTEPVRPTSSAASGPSVPLTREAAVRQFQQLRRQMGA